MSYRAHAGPQPASAAHASFHADSRSEYLPRITLLNHVSRFERLAAREDEFPRWPALVDILLGAVAPSSWGGREVHWPVWADEAMHRAHSMMHLAVRLERRALQQGSRAAWSASCLRKAIALADTFAELRILDDFEILPCSELLGDTAMALLSVFNPTEREPVPQIELESISMAAYKRRALILATSTLVLKSIFYAADRERMFIAGIKLRAPSAGQWCLTIIAEGVAPADGDDRETDDIIDGLANLLDSQDVRRTPKMGKFMTEIDFPATCRARPQHADARVLEAAT